VARSGPNPRKGARWRRFRWQVLQTYGPWCWLGASCRLGEPRIDLTIPWDRHNPHPGYYTVHHLDPLAHGGALLDLERARPAHLMCNQAQGTRPVEAVAHTQARW
jgi:hypothetical protein